ncbi:MAG: hypothetical protein JWL90_2054, partial [Chthoniobacteraceae bacterium]|nr:hypothetical protein [Chthoniobacteraceae bacterium]
MGKKHQKHPSSPPVVNPDMIEDEAAAEMQAG